MAKSEDVRKKQVRKYWGIDSAVIERMKRENYKENRAMREDTEIRREIQEYITTKKSQGKGRDDVLKRLNFIYGSREPYSKYKKYFEGWVDNAFRKDREQEER